MGLGDWLMASGEARMLHATTGRPVVIVDRRNRPQWHELFDGVPYLRRDHGPDTVRIFNAPGHRPYIAMKTPARWRWKTYSPTPAEIVFTPEELAFAQPFRGAVMIEPNVKAQGHTNKAWPRERWLQLVERIDQPMVQCVPQAMPALPPKVLKVITPTFRHACAVLSVARAFVGTEGGLMHAAAAVRTPAVILWSEFISPRITGYAGHLHIRHAGESCGSRRPCAGCAESMARISVDEVAQNLQEILR